MRFFLACFCLLSHSYLNKKIKIKAVSKPPPPLAGDGVEGGRFAKIEGVARIF